MQAVALGEYGSLDEIRRVSRASFDMITYEPAAADPWDIPYARLRRHLSP
jgi:hypothetical protein